MNKLQIRKAERKKAKLKIGLSAPSGAGKTLSALKLAKGLVGSWDKIVLIDTENGSGELYSHLGGYSVVTLEPPYSPERYIEFINGCVEAGFECIIVDSVSPEWDGSGGCLEINEMLAQTKFRGNTWGAWSDTKPRHRKFINAFLLADAHVITTSRNKIETAMGEDKKVKKLGMKEIQQEGYEYELTVSFNIDRETHFATPSKDRTELFEGKDPFLISEATGEMLKQWAESGKDEKVELIAVIKDLLVKIGTPATEKTEAYMNTLSVRGLKEMVGSYEKKLEIEEERKRMEAKIEEEQKKEVEKEKICSQCQKEMTPEELDTMKKLRATGLQVNNTCTACVKANTEKAKANA